MILVLGATGFLGKNVCKKLSDRNLSFQKTSLSMGLDLRDYKEVLSFFIKEKPKIILNCASYVGGIQWGLKRQADIFDNNVQMIANLFRVCNEVEIKRIVNPISNCVYPAKATFFKEEEIWDGPLHETVEVYGIMRKMSWIASKSYSKQFNLDTVNIVLSNMYGPEDHFDIERSHALGALIMKIVKAKQENLSEVIVWGSGKPIREWLHVSDGAEAMIRAMDINATTELINIGVGSGISIIEMAEKIKSYVNYNGKLVLDATKPDGAPYKTVDGRKGEKLMKWKPEINLDEGLKKTIEWYLEKRKV